MAFTPVHELQIIDGSAGLTIEEAAHVIILGGGRDASGHGLSERSADRLRTGAGVYTELDMLGNFVMTGYKTPTDTHGGPWQPGAGMPHENTVFTGTPEAYGQAELLQAITPELQATYGHGIPSSVQRIEPHSIDSITNFTNTEAEGLFGEGDERPVAIVSQASHLERVMQHAAPKTLRRDYIGIAAPDEGEPFTDTPLAALASRAILLGVSRRISAEKAQARSNRNARVVWGLAKIPFVLMNRAYNQTEAEA
jgi:hypothetical protein